MKYLDAPELAHLADILEYSSAECKVHTRFGQSHLSTLVLLPLVVRGALDMQWGYLGRGVIACCALLGGHPVKVRQTEMDGREG